MGKSGAKGGVEFQGENEDREQTVRSRRKSEGEDGDRSQKPGDEPGFFILRIVDRGLRGARSD